jgi:uncharacterized membrane protein
MIYIVFLILFYFLVPILIIYLTHINKTINKIGAIALAYLIGLILGNTGILPRGSDAFRALLPDPNGNLFLSADSIDKFVQAGTVTQNDLLVNQISSLQNMIYSILILIAIPLLLFSMDIKKWLKLAPEALKSLILGVVSLIIVIFAGYFLFVHNEPEGYKVAGMLVGVYTGGTPNLVAIATALKVSPNVFILTNTYDMVLGAFFLLFLMTIAQRLFNLVLPHFRDVKKHKAICKVIEETDGVDNYLGMLNRPAIKKLVVAFFLSILIVAISYGLGSLVSKNAQMAVIILTLTTLGLLASLIKKIKSIEHSFQLGMYFIIVFSLIIASMADLQSMFQIKFLNMFLFVAVAIFGSMIIHVGLSAIFKVDTDTTIMTITGLTYSPPFVPAVAAAIRNKEVMLTGITNGIIGYAIGNYLGVFIAYILKGL